MKPIMADYYEKTCPICGNKFLVVWKSQWVYKRGYGKNNSKYFCSWKCLRAFDERKESKRNMSGNGRYRLKIAKELVEITENGGNALDYLKGLGYRNPQQAYHDIKSYCKDNDPATFNRFPVKAKNMTKTAPETAVKISPIKVETPEAPKICKPVNYDGFECGSVKSTETGFRYEWSQEYNLFCIKAKGDEMTLCLEDMRALSRELPKAARVLGVEL